jgi:hypothetical protein
MREHDLLSAEWLHVLTMLPGDLETSAIERLAIRRRREVRTAADLLRMALVYSTCDYSLRQVAAWAKVAGVGDMSDVAVLKRLRGSAEWLGWLVLAWLRERGLTGNVPKRRVKIVDASVVMAPGGRGVDWRLHLGLDLGEERITSAEITGPEGGEMLQRHEVARDEVVLGDRGYAHREGVAHVLESGGHVVIRGNWQNFPLEHREGSPVDVVSCLELLGTTEIGDWDVQFRWGEKVYAVRLIAMRKSQVATEREQKRIRHQAQRKQHKPDLRSLRAAAFIFIITDLGREELPAAEALELYRLRWQIEMAFKRLKSILHLDHLRAHDPRLSRAYLYGKLLSALLIDELTRSAVAFSPWGFPLFPGTPQSLACAELDG